ncbi:hypothetical protein MD484_g8002, partial [Candolleomyces efflorescens]
MGLSRHVSQFVSRPSTYPWKNGFYFDELGSHHLAALYDLTGLLKSLGQSCGVTPRHQFTLLHLAAIGGHVETAKVILERWPEMSIRDVSLDGRTPLMLAAAYNQEEMVKFLLSVDREDFETLNTEAACGCTALASAINSGHTKIVELLTSSPGVRLNIRTCTRSPLSWAASGGHIPLLRRLLSHPEVEVNAQHPFTGYTALCYASRLGSLHAVEALLSRSEVDVQSGPRCGCTPLLLAALTAQPAVVSLLLSQPRINIHARCMHMGTALTASRSDVIIQLLLTHERILANATNEDVRLCLLHAARLGLKDTFSKTVSDILFSPKQTIYLSSNLIHNALDTTARFGLEDAFSKLAYGALEPSKSRMRPSVLVEAARRGHAAIVEMALQFVDVNAKDAMGWTALDAAAHAGHTHVVSLLLIHKASVMQKPWAVKTLPGILLYKSGSGPLTRLVCALGPGHGVNQALLSVITDNHGDSQTLLAACRGGTTPVVQALLLKPGIDVNVKDHQGRTPLAHAASHNHRKICEMLLSHPGVQLRAGLASSLLHAASGGHKETVEMLLQPVYAPDIDVNVEDSRGWTPLAYAVSNKCRSICCMLLAHPKIQPRTGEAPLLLQAASCGSQEVTEALLRSPSDLHNVGVNMEDKNGWTPLAHAAWNNHKHICHMLITHPEIQPCAGKASPLVRAAFRGYSEIVQMLLRSTHRLDINVTEEGWTTLSAASHSGSLALVQDLLARDDIDVNLGKPSPLIVAVGKGHTLMVKTLLAHPCINVNIRDSSRHGQPGACEPTALFYACRRGPPEIVQALLQHPDISVNATLRLDRGNPTLSPTTQVDSATNHTPFLESLAEAWGRVCPPISPPETFSTPLHVAASANNRHEIVLLLLEVEDLNLNSLNEKGESALALILDSNASRSTLFLGFLKTVTLRFLASPNAVRKEPDILRRAVQTRNVEVVQIFLEHCDRATDFGPALTTALLSGQADIVALLLDVPGIDLNARSGRALLLACRRPSPLMAKLLLDHPKIDPNTVTNGQTALANACYYGREEIVSCLLSTKGIDVNAGKYHPLMLAAQAGQARVVAQLIEACGTDIDIDVNQCAYGEEGLKAAHLSAYSLPPPAFRPFGAPQDCWLKEAIVMPATVPSTTAFPIPRDPKSL